MRYIDVPDNGAWIEHTFRCKDGDMQVLLFNPSKDCFSWYSVADCSLKLHIEGDYAFLFPNASAPEHGDARPSLAVNFKKAS